MHRPIAAKQQWPRPCRSGRRQTPPQYSSLSSSSDCLPRSHAACGHLYLPRPTSSTHLSARPACNKPAHNVCSILRTHTHARLTALFPGLPTSAGTRKVKPIWILLKQVCTSLQTDNRASTPPLSFLQAGCSSCHPTDSIKALKAIALKAIRKEIILHATKIL